MRYYEKGLALERLSQDKEALAAFESALSLDPTIVQGQYHKGLVLFRMKRYMLSLGGIRISTCAGPDPDRCLVLQRSLLCASGKQSCIYHGIHPCMDLNPRHYDAYFEKGLVLSDMGNYNEAVTELSHALDIDDSKSDAHYAKGLALEALGRYDDALSSFTRTVTLDPGYSNAYFNQGVVLMQLGNLP